MGSFTFSMIKPAAVEANKSGAILNLIENHGFRVVALKKLLLSENDAKAFYIDHKGKPFYDDLVAFMSSAPVVAMVLSKENAVADFRKLMGSTNPEEAEEGTIRKLFATSMRKNAIHGSDSDQNAIRESNFFFSKMERF